MTLQKTGITHYSILKRAYTTLVAITLTGMCGTAMAKVLPDYQMTSPWFTEAQASVKNKVSASKDLGHAKNVILFVGDGMGISTLTAARILDGQQKQYHQFQPHEFHSCLALENFHCLQNYNR